MDYSPTNQAYGPTARRLAEATACEGCYEFVTYDGRVLRQSDENGRPLTPHPSQHNHMGPGGCMSTLDGCVMVRGRLIGCN